MISRLVFWLLDKYILWKGGDDMMAVIYVSLIIAGMRTYKSVPQILKEEVKKILETQGLGNLAVEE